MAATGGSRHKEIWSPVIENEESDEKNETIDLSTTTSKSLMNTIQHHPISFPSFPLPPVFPLGHFGLTRMPFIMPPFNHAFLAMYTKSFQQLPKAHQSETKNVSKKLACSPSKEDNANAIAAAAAASTEKATQNPI
uniref:Uncharacterized protein n=1 Tax=Panagrolaimus sp. PS1159 TaxID=55785 RepID=A0AC35FRQ4_9BILA